MVNAFLVVSFIVFLVFVGLFIWYLYQYLNLVNTQSQNQNNSNNVACSEDALLQAWIEGLNSKPGCPPLVNNYSILGENIQMFSNDFQVDNQTQCCWFSQQANQQTYFPNPWICIANVNGTTFSLTELNQDPYSFNSGTITYLIPPCEPDQSQCIGLIRFATSGQNGLYKVFQYTGSNNLNNFSSVVFEISPDCLSLVQITLNGAVIANGTQLTVPQNEVPGFVLTVITLFENGRFYPIAGANPPLSALAAG